MKKKENAGVISQTRLCDDIFDLRIRTGLARDAHPGQFVGVFTGDASRLLPRPISICDAADDELRLVYRVTGPDTGTRIISRLKAGDTVDILGILGNGYDTSRICADYSHPVLLGGGIGIPPMLMLARKLSADIPETTAVLGFRDSNTFLSEDFDAVCGLRIATEDGSLGTGGNVLDVLKTGDIPCDVIMACGPMPMLRAVAAYAAERRIRAFVSLEERMACGVGACLGCITRTRDTDAHSQVRNARICTEGPVFEADMLAWD